MYLSLQLDCKHLEGRALLPFGSLIMPRRVLCVHEGWDRRHSFHPRVVHSPAGLTVCAWESSDNSQPRGPRLLSIATDRGDCDARRQGRQNQKSGSRIGVCLYFRAKVQEPRRTIRSGPPRSLGSRTCERTSLGKEGVSIRKLSVIKDCASEGAAL